jgi:septum formation protein
MNKKIILASKSPRRQELIKGLELAYDIHTYEVDESFPAELHSYEIAVYLAKKKALHFPGDLTNHILLTADTIVWVNDRLLNKPEDEDDAFRMLKTICGTTHEVFTGVCLRTTEIVHTFFERTEVTCKQLPDDEIWHYIHQYHPFDKAGSYGIQDWFGYTAVQKINGCFYNVMGLPVSRVNEELKKLGV